MTSSPLRLLLVEDNPADHAIILENLEDSSTQRDFVLERVDCLEQAIERLMSAEYDLLLLDLNLPDSSGMETLTTCTSRFPDVPVVVLTHQADPIMGRQAVQAGAQDFVNKNLMEIGAGDLLLRIIDHAIERKRIYLALESSQSSFRSLVEKN
ncbi:MAG: response regulator, partial [Magnetococcales bacterium]|nr:response regulator [Magnetococcales bacterium]